MGRLYPLADQPRKKADDVIFAAVFLGQPLEINLLVALVGHDDAVERGVAADECRQKSVQAGGLAGAGIPGEKEMPVGLVAGPSKTGKCEHDLPRVGDDLSGRIADVTAMSGVVKWRPETAGIAPPIVRLQGPGVGPRWTPLRLKPRLPGAAPTARRPGSW